MTNDGLPPTTDAEADRLVLAGGTQWQLEVTPAAALELAEFDGDRGLAVPGVGHCTRPVTLNETEPFFVDDVDGQPVTLIAGPVDDRAARVEFPVAGTTVEATLHRAAGLTWLLATFDGHIGLDSVIAYDADGVEIDRRTHPPHSGPEGPQDRTTIGYQGNHSRLLRGRGGPVRSRSVR